MTNHSLIEGFSLGAPLHVSATISIIYQALEEKSVFVGNARGNYNAENVYFAFDLVLAFHNHFFKEEIFSKLSCWSAS